VRVEVESEGGDSAIGERPVIVVFSSAVELERVGEIEPSSGPDETLVAELNLVVRDLLPRVVDRVPELGRPRAPFHRAEKVVEVPDVRAGEEPEFGVVAGEEKLGPLPLPHPAETTGDAHLSKARVL